MTKKDLLRYSFVFLTFLGVFSTYPKAVYQARAEEPAGDVIYISTPQEFQDINLDLTAHYEIVNDIDFTGFPIEAIAVNSDFTGTLDGNNYKIKNIKFTIPINFGPVIIGGSQYIQPLNISLIHNNNGEIKNLIVENIYFFNSQSNVIQLSSLNPGPNSFYELNFSPFIKTNKENGILDNLKIIYHDFNFFIRTQSYSNFWEQAYMLNLKVSLFAQVNYGLIINSTIDYLASVTIQITNGYRNSNVIFALINENFGEVNNVSIYYEGFLYIENSDSSYTYYSVIHNKSFLLSLFINSNFGFVSEIKLNSKLYLGLSVNSIKNIFIKTALFSNHSSNSSTIRNVRISNNTFFNYGLDHSGYGDQIDFQHDLFSNELSSTFVENIYIENNELAEFSINWANYMSQNLIISNFGAISTDTEVRKIIISGNPKYQFYYTSNLWRLRLLYYSSFRQIDGQVNFNSSIINIFPIVFLNSNDLSFVNTFIYNSSFETADFLNLTGLNIYSYNEYLFFASKLSSRFRNIIGPNGTDFGIWDSNQPNYFKQDSTFKSIRLSLLQTMDVLLLDENWSINQLTLDQFPTLSFTLLDFSLLNNQRYNLNQSYQVNNYH